VLGAVPIVFLFSFCFSQLAASPVMNLGRHICYQLNPTPPKTISNKHFEPEVIGRHWSSENTIARGMIDDSQKSIAAERKNGGNLQEETVVASSGRRR